MSDNITKEEIIEQFKGNKILKYSTYAVGGIAVIVLAVLSYQKFVSGPNEEASKAEIANGILYFEQGDYELALNTLKGVKLDDTYLMTLAIGTQGHCYSELGDYQNAVKMYIKAAERVENETTTPLFYFKAGLIAEEAGDFSKAAEYYKIIKTNYLSFASQKGIDKFITRAENSIIE